MQQLNVPTQIMCADHIAREHKYTHQLAEKLRDKSAEFFIRQGRLNPYTLVDRHEGLVEEAEKRDELLSRSQLDLSCEGLVEFERPEKVDGHIDVFENLDELVRGCDECRALWVEVASKYAHRREDYRDDHPRKFEAMTMGLARLGVVRIEGRVYPVEKPTQLALDLLAGREDIRFEFPEES